MLVCLSCVALLFMDRGEFDYIWFASGISPARTAWLGSACVWSHRLLLEADHATYDGTGIEQFRRRMEVHVAREPGLAAEKWGLGFDRDNSGISWLGFKYFHRTTRTLAKNEVVETRRVRGVAIPVFWIAAATAAPGPVWMAGLVRRRSRRRRGACAGCGYDLRASSGLCPECGRVIPLKSGQN